MPANKKSPAKRTTTNRTASVGGIKTKSKKRFFLFSLIAVLVLAGIGYGGYYAYQRHSRNKLASNFKANAANYGAVVGYSSGYYNAMACWKQYSSNKPDEVWILMGRTNNYVVGSYWYVNKGDSLLVRRDTVSRSWWNGSIQSFHIPVGRANILNGAYISGGWIPNRVGGYGGYLPGSARVVGGALSLTSYYKGARVAYPGYPTLSYPLIKGLPVCNY